MPIIVDWNKKIGKAVFHQSIDGEDKVYTLDLYEGNAFLVMIHDNGDERTLNCFFLDSGHMERCLKDGMFNRSWDKMTAITINKAKYCHYKEVVALLTEYLDDIDISVYKDGEQTWMNVDNMKLVSDIRMRELAEQAISYLDDNDMLEEFMEDRDIEFDHDEKTYFGIYEEEM